MLRAIADDMGRQQTEVQRDTQSKGLADPTAEPSTAASAHGAIRHRSGFDLIQVVSDSVLCAHSGPASVGDGSGDLENDDIRDLTRFNESIDQALAESVASYSAKIDESRDTFLAVLGHDLRAPLASLSNCVEVQGRFEPSPDSGNAFLHIAKRSVASMHEMITDLLEYTRTRLGRGLEVCPRPGKLNTLCAEILEEARAAHPRSRFEYEGSEDVVAVFDHARIHQVLINLLNNAVQHGDAAQRSSWPPCAGRGRRPYWLFATAVSQFR